MLMMLVCEASSQNNHRYYSYFSVKGEVSLPLTIKTNKRNYTVRYNGQCIEGNFTIYEVIDGNGRKVLDTSHDKMSYSSEESKYWYVFEYLYTNNSNSSSSSSSYSNNASSGFSDALVSFFTSGSNDADDCYPNLTFQAGVSNVYGEFIRAKGCLGEERGLYLYGGIGRDYIFDPKDPDYMGDNAKKKMTWHVGLGFYRAFTDSEIIFAFDYADTPIAPNKALNAWLGGAWYFANDSHLGIFGGIGACLGNFKSGETIETKLGFEAGLAYRFFSD